MQHHKDCGVATPQSLWYRIRISTWMTAVTAQIHSVNPSEIMWVIHRLKVIIADDLDNANSVCQRVYGRRD